MKKTIAIFGIMAMALLTGCGENVANTQTVAPVETVEPVTTIENPVLQDFGISDALYPPEFQTKWKVEQSSDAEQNLTVRLQVGSVEWDYDAFIEWGDGRSTKFVWTRTGGIPVGGMPVVAHKYDREGIYHVNIVGQFPHIQIIGGEEKLLEIEHWGNGVIKSLASSYRGATNLKITAPDTPVFGYFVDMRYAFSLCGDLDADFSRWEFSESKNMTGFLSDTNLSQDNYDELLLSIGTQNLRSGVTFDASNKHSDFVSPVLDEIRNAYNWTITDGGEL